MAAAVGALLKELRVAPDVVVGPLGRRRGGGADGARRPRQAVDGGVDQRRVRAVRRPRGLAAVAAGAAAATRRPGSRTCSPPRRRSGGGAPADRGHRFEARRRRRRRLPAADGASRSRRSRARDDGALGPVRAAARTAALSGAAVADRRRARPRGAAGAGAPGRRSAARSLGFCRWTASVILAHEEAPEAVARLLAPLAAGPG
ncbi:MAG: hypothetical protein MZW92_18505 [Comamonadaceae bacterium]|nr:hypothetical protein [Comamonadaceae bacterium]